MSLSLVLVALLYIVNIQANYLEFNILRNPHPTKKMLLVKSECQDPAALQQSTKFVELCYEKDIAYLLQFDKNKYKYLLALDFTSPISWIKSSSCLMIPSNKKCHLIKESFGEEIKEKARQKVTEMISILKSKVDEDDEDESAMIQGSNEVIMGRVQKIANMSIIGIKSNRLTNILDMVLMGLYILGEYDQITLNQTTFIHAKQITYNLNLIEDGAISLRMDDSSERSFINELFTNIKNPESIISVYLSEGKNVVTIGGMSAKYSECGLSQFVRIKLFENDKYGKLPKLQAITLENEETQEDPLSISTGSQVVFTLSASYLAFCQEDIQQIIKSFFPSFKCRVNKENYLQCNTKNKQEDLDNILNSNLDLDFDTSIAGFSLRDLVLIKNESFLLFNIKRAYANYTIVGQPFFLKYYVYFDYAKDQIGFAIKKPSLSQSLFQTITILHFIVCILALICCFSFTSQSFINIYSTLFWAFVQKGKENISNLSKAYKPLENEPNEEVETGRQAGIQEAEDI